MSDEADDDEDFIEEEDEEFDTPAERYYSNRARTLPGPFELTIDFGYHVRHSEPIDWLARISISWEEALILRKLIDSAVAEYQHVVGPIRDIEGIDPRFGTDATSGNGARRPGDEDEPDEEKPDE